MENDLDDDVLDIRGLENDAELEFEQDVADEEERERLLEQIKDEIRQKVRRELQSDKMIAQLDDPAAKISEFELIPEHAIETGDLSSITDEKLREAIIRMRKYDALLAVKSENERQVKRSRLIERQRIRREMLATLTRNGGNVKTNIDQFFEADSRVLRKYYTGVRIPTGSELEGTSNQAIPIEYHEKLSRVEADELRTLNGADRESECATPIFKTQVDDYVDRQAETSSAVGGTADGANSKQSGAAKGANKAEDAKARGASRQTQPDGRDSNASGTTGATSATGTTATGLSSNTTATSSKNAKKNAARNFVRRNIELASHANETIALTNDERDRLDRLLADVTAFGDEAPLTFDESNSNSNSNRSKPYDALHASSNGQHFSLLPASAFSGEIDEVDRLREIETRLTVYQDDVLAMAMAETDRESLSRSRLDTASTTTTTASKQPPAPSRNNRRSGAAAAVAAAAAKKSGTDASETAVPATPNETEVDTDRLGESTLQEIKDAREQRAALAAIENAIGDFHAPRLIQAHPLSRSELDTLVQGSVRALSRAYASSTSSLSDTPSLTTAASSYRQPSVNGNASALLSGRQLSKVSSVGDRESVIELRKSADLSARSGLRGTTPTGRELVVAPLDSDTLRQLLDEARREGVMYVPQSLIGTIAEESNEDGDGDSDGEGDGDVQPSVNRAQLSRRDAPAVEVSDETWQRISEEQPDPNVYGPEAADGALTFSYKTPAVNFVRQSTASSSRTMVDEPVSTPALPTINLSGNVVTQRIPSSEYSTVPSTTRSSIQSLPISQRERSARTESSARSSRGRPTSSD